MGFNFFKKNNKQKEPEKVYSRFTFAHDDDDIDVERFFINFAKTTQYSEISADTVFICEDIYDLYCNEYITPIFKMPKSLPITKLVSSKKVICIGAIITNEDDLIYSISNKFTGMSLEDVVAEINENDDLTETSEVTIMNMSDVIRTEVIDGQIDFGTLSRYVTLKNTLRLLMNNN